MKRIVKFSVIIAVLSIAASCASGKFSKGFDRKITEQVDTKIVQMQELIEFNNEQAFKLKKVELEYLKGLKEAKTCKDCDAKSLEKKLQEKRTIQLKNILERSQYIKYDAIDNDRIKQIDLMAK